MLIKQVNQKSAIFVTIGIFLNKIFKFQSYVCNRYNDLKMIFMNFSDIAILNVNGADYCCIVSRSSKKARTQT